VDEAAEPITSDDVDVVAGREWFRISESVWCPLSEGSVWPVFVVVVRILVEDKAEVALSGDEDAVGCLAAA
jgi:hypothetical protein